MIRSISPEEALRRLQKKGPPVKMKVQLGWAAVEKRTGLIVVLTMKRAKKGVQLWVDSDGKRAKALRVARVRISEVIPDEDTMRPEYDFSKAVRRNQGKE